MRTLFNLNQHCNTYSVVISTRQLLTYKQVERFDTGNPPDQFINDGVN